MNPGFKNKKNRNNKIKNNTNTDIIKDDDFKDENSLSSRKILRTLFVRILIILIILSFLITIIPFRAFGETTPVETLKTYLDESFKKLKVPGAAAVLIDKDKVITHFYGKNQKGDINENSLFLTGSLSESMTAIGILRLVDEGKLTLDTKIIEVLPDFVNANPYTADIRIKELLTHTSGITKEDGYKYTNLGEKGPSAITNALKKVAKLKPKEKKFKESNLNYLILGAVIEKISGYSFNDYMYANVFQPLGMNNTYSQKEIAEDHGMVKGNTSFLGLISKSRLEYDDAGAPYGYIASDVKDISLYMKYLMSPKGEPILKNQTKKLLTTAVYKKDFRNNYSYGLYLINPDTSNLEAVSNGLMGDYNSIVSIMPDKNQAIAVFVNKGHSLESNNLYVFKENLKKVFTNSTLIPVKTQIPIIEIAFALLSLIILIYFLIRISRIRKPWEFAWGDMVMSIFQISIGLFLIQGIKIFLGYPYGMIKVLAPDVAIALLIISIFLFLHGFITLLKHFVLDKNPLFLVALKDRVINKGPKVSEFPEDDFLSEYKESPEFKSDDNISKDEILYYNNKENITSTSIYRAYNTVALREKERLEEEEKQKKQLSLIKIKGEIKARKKEEKKEKPINYYMDDLTEDEDYSELEDYDSTFEFESLPYDVSSKWEETSDREFNIFENPIIEESLKRLRLKDKEEKEAIEKEDKLNLQKEEKNDEDSLLDLMDVYNYEYMVGESEEEEIDKLHDELNEEEPQEEIIEEQETLVPTSEEEYAHMESVEKTEEIIDESELKGEVDLNENNEEFREFKFSSQDYFESPIRNGLAVDTYSYEPFNEEHPDTKIGGVRTPEEIEREAEILDLLRKKLLSEQEDQN